MVQMDEYVNLPAQRLNHLVRKYVHHCRMKDIEGIDKTGGCDIYTEMSVVLHYT